MAINLIARNARKVRQNNLGQRFKYLLVLDFEATCDKDTIIEPQEIIEVPCIAVNTQNWNVENTFHEYVKPRINPILTPFCTDLTGIMQETIENENHFPVVFDKFCKWLEANNFTNNPEQSAFVTCGDWDLKVMLPNQCTLDNIPIPSYLKQWINLKAVYCEATEYFPRSLKDMFNKFKLPMEGKLHSGIHDTMNMVKIVQILGSTFQTRFNITSSFSESDKINK
ncbi:ERI1 exoribonuclease 3 [Chelonus insularis]|uniref:ERI1 exoribonuclease 3 n=1 Tax=Chelonus insularis TaxID=460826 RepID=UPI00158D4065|nr:ERI1 exoribonuclease 3 [Chelonus insularis]